MTKHQLRTKPLNREELQALLAKISALRVAMFDLSGVVQEQNSDMSYEFSHKYPFKGSFYELVHAAARWEAEMESKLMRARPASSVNQSQA